MEPPNLTVAFAVWAAVVAMIGGAIVFELSRLRNELKALTVQLNEYIISMERRVTHIEAHLKMSNDTFSPLYDRRR